MIVAQRLEHQVVDLVVGGSNPLGHPAQMVIKTGVDIIYLPRFKTSVKRAGQTFLKRVFQENELEDKRIEHLAGIFAAKEAIIKALNLPIDSWLSIKITNTASGQPKVQIFNSQLATLSYSISISHDGNYVIAQYVAITG